MTMGLIDRMVGEKRRWRQYKARTARLPEGYRRAVGAIERYLMHLGPGDGALAATMFDDLADLFEQAAADGTPVREVVGEDPVEFVDAFIRNYAKGGWIDRQRARLVRDIDEAAAHDGTGGGS